jgi:hypothetical protein
MKRKSFYTEDTEVAEDTEKMRGSGARVDRERAAASRETRAGPLQGEHARPCRGGMICGDIVE